MRLIFVCDAVDGSSTGIAMCQIPVDIAEQRTSGIVQVSETRHGLCDGLLGSPASQKRQGGKSRCGGLRWCGARYGDLRSARVIGQAVAARSDPVGDPFSDDTMLPELGSRALIRPARTFFRSEG